MDDLELDLSPEEYAVKMRPVLRNVVQRYGCLTVSGPHGRTLSRGTVSFLASGNDRYLLTAGHVVEGLLKLSERLEVVRATDPEVPSLPKTIFVDRNDLLWSSKTPDLALLRAPDALREDTSVKWFELHRGKHMIRLLRENWDKRDSPYLLLAMGIPNFGHLGGQMTNGQWVEVLGMMSIPARIALLRSKPDGDARMMLEVTATDPIHPPDASPLAAGIYQTIKDNPPSKSIDLGGISGGPLIVVAENGDSEIVAVVSEGSIIEADDGGVRLLQAIPIDEAAIAMQLNEQE